MLIIHLKASLVVFNSIIYCICIAIIFLKFAVYLNSGEYLCTQLPIIRKKEPWNKGKLVGQKLALKQKQIWAIRIGLEISGNVRDLALFSLGLDSKLRGCD
jgi:hypothetical protein